MQRTGSCRERWRRVARWRRMGKLWMGETSHPHVMVQHSTPSGPPVTAPLPASWTQHQLTGSTVDPFKLSLTFFHPLIVCHSCCLLLPVSAPALPPAPVFFLATLPAPGPFPAGREGRFCLLAAALPLNQVDVGVDKARSRPWVVGRLLLVYVAGHLQCKQCRGTLHMGRVGSAPEGEKKAVVGELERGGG